MTPEQATQAVHDQARVRLRTGPGTVYAEGRIISYSIVPTVTIETDDGERISWRHDMADALPQDADSEPASETRDGGAGL